MDQDTRAIIAAYLQAFPSSSPVITTRLLTKKDAIQDGDLYLFLNDPKSPHFPHAQGCGWNLADATAKLKVNLISRLDQVEADATAKLAKFEASTQQEKARLATAKQLLLENILSGV